MRTGALRYDAQAGRLVWVDVTTGQPTAGDPPSDVPDLSASSGDTEDRADADRSSTRERHSAGG